MGGGGAEILRRPFILYDNDVITNELEVKNKMDFLKTRHISAPVGITSTVG